MFNIKTSFSHTLFKVCLSLHNYVVRLQQLNLKLITFEYCRES